MWTRREKQLLLKQLYFKNQDEGDKEAFLKLWSDTIHLANQHSLGKSQKKVQDRGNDLWKVQVP